MIHPLPPDLQAAIDLLFADQILSASGSLPYRIELADIKREFRRKAMQYHPDRAVLLGESKGQLEEKFKLISHAYGVLKSELNDEVLILRPDGTNRAEPPRKETEPFHHFSGRNAFTGAGRKPAADPKPRQTEFARRSPPFTPTPDKQFFFRGGLPRRSLRLGEFLFYRRIITWRTLIDALVWQHRVRPRVGRIAVDLNYMEYTDIFDILRKKSFKEPFGQAAVRLGFISDYRRMVLLGRQRSYNQPLGKFFLDYHILTPVGLTRCIQENRLHNIHYAKPLSRT